MQQFPRTVDGNLTEIVIEAHQNQLGQTGLGTRLPPEGAVDRRRDGFGNPPGVNQPGGVAGGPHLHRRIGPQKPPPGQAHQLAVKIGEIPAAQAAQPHHHPAGGAQPEIGQVELAQAAAEFDPAGNDVHPGQIQCPQLAGANPFQPGRDNGKQAILGFFHRTSPKERRL